MASGSYCPVENVQPLPVRVAYGKVDFPSRHLVLASLAIPVLLAEMPSNQPLWK